MTPATLLDRGGRSKSSHSAPLGPARRRGTAAESWLWKHEKRHARVQDTSNWRDEYEAIVPFVLERVHLGAADIGEAIARYQNGREPEPDRDVSTLIAQ